MIRHFAKRWIKVEMSFRFEDFKKKIAEQYGDLLFIDEVATHIVDDSVSTDDKTAMVRINGAITKFKLHGSEANREFSVVGISENGCDNKTITETNMFHYLPTEFRLLKLVTDMESRLAKIEKILSKND